MPMLSGWILYRLCGEFTTGPLCRIQFGLVRSVEMKIIEELTRRTFDGILFAGGAAKGQLWPQIIADVLNSRVKVPPVK